MFTRMDDSMEEFFFHFTLKSVWVCYSEIMTGFLCNISM